MSYLYQKVTDSKTGEVSYVEIPPATSALLEVSIKCLSAVGGYLKARLGETSTHLGAVAVPVACPAIADSVSKAIAALSTGDYVGAASNIAPAVLGLFGLLAAIVAPDPVNVVTHVIDSGDIRASGND